jgi:hypothetical protein
MSYHELVLLLPGNTMVIPIGTTDTEATVTDRLKDACLNHPEEWLTVSRYTVRPASILGFYFKEHTEPDSKRVVALLEKAVNDQAGGENWKDG